MWWRKVSDRLPAAARRAAAADERDRKAGLNPDRSRDYFTYTAAEGLPD